MRITGGKYSGLRIPTKFASHVRPTTDRVRESLFNKLYHTVNLKNCNVLDLFSGSGIIALEFLSYGCNKVVSVDKDSKNIMHQKAIKSKMQIENWTIIKADVFKFIEENTQKWDIIFADPPYSMSNITEFPTLVIPHLQLTGTFILEHSATVYLGRELKEQKNYGETMLTFF